MKLARTRLLVLGSLLLAWSSPTGLAQERSVVPGEAGLEQEARALVPVVLEGLVLEADGTPAIAALVTSSAGGKSLTGSDGTYRLEVQAPRGAERLRVTAVGAGSRSTLAGQDVALLATASMAVAPLLLSSSTACAPRWLPTFGETAVDGTIFAASVFDDGSGPALFVGGSFTRAGGVSASCIAKWDGASWSALGTGMSISGSTPYVWGLTVFDDGNGPALYVCGYFTHAGGVSVNHIAKWNGSSWSDVGGGRAGPVHAMAVFDAGSGEALYVGGGANSGPAIGRLARWNGASWLELGTVLNGQISDLMVFDDGSGPSLCVAGQFSSAGGSPASNIARWNGTWSPLGTGLNNSVGDLAVFDDGNGPALYAVGSFSGQIARWNGSWSPVGGMPYFVLDALTTFDDGTGPALYVGGSAFGLGMDVANGVARWDGSVGSGLGSGAPDKVYEFAAFDDGSGPALYACGAFDMAAWNGSSWKGFGEGVSGSVLALTAFDDGSGPALYAGGQFERAGGVVANGIGRWDGASLSPLGSGFSHSKHPSACQVSALAVFDDGSGPALHAGGLFTHAGGVAASCVAKWDGSAWSPLGAGLIAGFGGFGTTANALAAFDDGSGPALYAAGSFTKAGAVSARGIARWDGSSWSSIGNVSSTDLIIPQARALAVFDDGSGPALYVAGAFTHVGGVLVNHIAKWDGSGWSALGSGFDVPDPLFALAVFDDGSGPALYAGGEFFSAGGVPANHIARWNGASWSALGSGLATPSSYSYVRALTVLDDGSGPALYVGGLFRTAGGVAVQNVARWNGSWAPVGGGTNAEVDALAVFVGAGPPALAAGGSFSSAIDSGDSFLALWGCDAEPPVLSCPPVVTEAYTLGGTVVNFSVTASDLHDPSPVIVCEPPSGSLFPGGTTTVTCTATDASGNQATCAFPVIVSLKKNATKVPH